MGVRVDIEKDILTWAITRAGHNIDEFLMQFPLYLDWIDETKKPTVKQLEGFSKKLNVPFGYLFLETPPLEESPIPFFRTNEQDELISLNVRDTILALQQRQEWLSEYLQDNGFDTLPFIGKYNEHSEVSEVVDDMRRTFRLDSDWAENFSTWEETLLHLTNVIEDTGIIVTFNGVVGNNTKRKIKVEECRGFVLTDEYAPFMFVNNSDSKSAQMFTIVHELAHIWIGESAGFDFRQLQPADNGIEMFCDKVAAEFLVPEKQFLEAWGREGNDIKKIARAFKVSPIVIARRAMDLQLITRSDFFGFYDKHMTDFYNFKQDKKSGGNFYATAKKRLSLSFAAHLNNATKSNKLMYRDAYKLAGMKGDTFHTFMSKYGL